MIDFEDLKKTDVWKDMSNEILKTFGTIKVNFGGYAEDSENCLNDIFDGEDQENGN